MKAVIADDEPLLAKHLKARLAALWPQLEIAGVAANGIEAREMIEDLRPDIAFLDIRMPGLTGLELVQVLSPEARRACRVVFVTAYDEFAVQAFEREAVDYLLKPVQTERLQKTVAKLRTALANHSQASTHFEATMVQLRGLLNASATLPVNATLKLIQVSVGNAIRMVPVVEVVYLEAADKYVRILTSNREYLIRTPLKELLPQLDASMFWQIHRGSVVNSTCIEAVTRDEAGKLSVSLRSRPEKLPVSRLYVHLFKAM